MHFVSDFFDTGMRFICFSPVPVEVFGSDFMSTPVEQTDNLIVQIWRLDVTLDRRTNMRNVTVDLAHHSRLIAQSASSFRSVPYLIE